MPAVEAEALLRTVERIGTHSLHAGVRRREGNVAVVGFRVLEIIGAAEIVLRGGTADRRVCGVAVQVEFDLALTPPACVVDAPRHVRADVLPLAAHAVEDRVNALVRQRVHAAELRVEIGAVRPDVGQRVVDLVVHRHRVVRAVFERHAAPPAKRHRPVAVERAARIDADRKRGDLHVFLPAAAEEIADRALHRGRLLFLPVDAQDRAAPLTGRRQPNVLDRAGALDVRDLKHRARLDDDIRVHLPARAEVARRIARRTAFERAHAALPLFPGEILRADRAGLCVRQARKIAHVHA